ncbi:MAG: sulfurtransferase [Candidatus Eisenbacteria bacterium]|uniref:Sulfurtransferase n=1 Tax=Eiseniibacteriota bacterium TaxID=2212470 RepID=A0A849STS9_UNCEI|nr:sulfurtransferase [Candidatus Eisenbacteria bacterium]
MSKHAQSEVLVTTDWVKANLDAPSIKLVEVDVDTLAYDAGHIAGAIGFNWQTQLQDRVRRDILSKETFEQLMGDHGIGNDDIVVLYGDNNNWFAAYAFWLFRIYGHRDVRLMNGGRVKWLAEDDKALTVVKPTIAKTRYVAREPDRSLRALVVDVLRAVEGGSHNLIDVRSPDEFTGKLLAPPGLSETAQRAGHVPGARSVPWSRAVNPDGTFKSVDELRTLYLGDAQLDPAKPTIAYCRIGERSSHTWFVLTYLLDLKDVRNYDGSWTEYGSMIGVPIERDPVEALATTS